MHFVILSAQYEGGKRNRLSKRRLVKEKDLFTMEFYLTIIIHEIPKYINYKPSNYLFIGGLYG